MLLTVDVGNTMTGAALFRGRSIVHRGRVPTPASWTRRHLSALLPAAMAGQVGAVIVSSVVPRLDRGLGAAIRRSCSLRPLFIDHRTPTGIKLRIDRPFQLGADRIADCAGALALFPPPLIVIDSGTATTFDLIDAAGDYRGGCILPGVALAIKSLAENTAKLKKVAFAVPRSPVGTNTNDSIRAGIFFGYVGALQHLLSLYRAELGRRTKVVATGGLVRHFQGQVRGIDACEPDLIFLGLRSIHERLVATK
ncbi:MAG: type III pantothenate kinase [Acidobacteriota bacterium]|nr:type III pantothenate kinase [Acidobacteriota bacterium]